MGPRSSYKLTFAVHAMPIQNKGWHAVSPRKKQKQKQSLCEQFVIIFEVLAELLSAELALALVSGVGCVLCAVC